MKKLLAFFLFLGYTSLAVPAQADHGAWVATFAEGNSVTLHEAPCDVPSIRQMFVDAFGEGPIKMAVVVWDGEVLAACWASVTIQGQAVAYIVDETGDQGALPPEIFKPAKSV